MSTASGVETEVRPSHRLPPEGGGDEADPDIRTQRKRWSETRVAQSERPELLRMLGARRPQGAQGLASGARRTVTTTGPHGLEVTAVGASILGVPVTRPVSFCHSFRCF